MAGYGQKLAIISLCLAITGCQEGAQFGAAGGGGLTNRAPAEPQVIERDVEAPEVFERTEAALWDGRPSLGGVWVAHPDVKEPERVIIRNDASGKFVVGALFRRERENPGPILQVSSDAADALGMLAGQPMRLNVTALRREEVAEEPEQEEVMAASLDAPAEIAAQPLDPIAGAAAAIDKAETAAQPVETAAAPAPKPAEAPKPKPKPKASGLDKPFIQIGIFSVEANADATAERLRSNGLTATVLAQSSQGKSFWRVVVGPAPTETDRAAVLSQIKSLGFPDAYAVTN